MNLLSGGLNGQSLLWNWNLTELEINQKYFVSKSWLQDTHREKPPSNEIPALTKSMNRDI